MSNKRNWWPTAKPQISEGAPFRLNNYMPRASFEGILLSLNYTDRKYVEYNDGLFHICKKEESWNMNMAEDFDTSWINVLDESMMEWFNKYAPGFMCIGRKPHPLGNESHTICCCLASILRRSQIAEGKDHPQQLGQK